MKYKVSIIIPVYKVEKYLRKALDSLVNQTLKDIEIICINDCSPDNSAEILNEYASKDKRFIIINQETNQGQGVARNIGIEKATGKYIMFLDPDDWFELNACETAYNAAEKYSANAVYFPNYIVSEISGKEYTTNLIKEYSEKYNIEIKPYTFYNFLDLPHTTFRTFGMAPWRYMCLTEMIITNNVKFSDYRKGEDQPFSININLISKILYIDKPLYNYLERSDSSRIYETLYE
ncbi:glycosyltransferase family 2 protein, partial [bacterium]|nr:glycosyltransferase family 2 protein [bacterium]